MQHKALLLSRITSLVATIISDCARRVLSDIFHGLLHAPTAFPKASFYFLHLSSVWILLSLKVRDDTPLTILRPKPRSVDCDRRQDFACDVERQKEPQSYWSTTAADHIVGLRHGLPAEALRGLQTEREQKRRRREALQECGV